MKEIKLNYRPLKSRFWRTKSKSANLLWENLVSMTWVSINRNSPKSSIAMMNSNQRCWPTDNCKKQWKVQPSQLLSCSSSIVNVQPRTWTWSSSAWLCSQRVAPIRRWRWASTRSSRSDRRSSWMPAINSSSCKTLCETLLMFRRSKTPFEPTLKITRLSWKMIRIWCNKWTSWKSSWFMIRNWAR